MASVIESKETSPVQMPISAFGVLERKSRDVRLAAIERAKFLAIARVKSDLSNQEPEVTPDHIAQALEYVAGSGELAFDEAPQVSVQPESRRLLERRLDRLQSFVMQQAGVIGLTAEAVELAWQIVWENPNLRNAALT